MTALLVLVAAIVLDALPAYAHGEQILSIVYPHLLLLAGWLVYLVKLKASLLNKVAIYGVLLVTVALTYLISIPGWYRALLDHPILVPFVYAAIPLACTMAVAAVLLRGSRRRSG